MAQLVALGYPGCQQLTREEPLDQVVDAAVALPPAETQDARLGEGFENRPDLVRRPPVPVDRSPRLNVR